MTGTPGSTHGVQSVARAFEMLELMAAAGGTLGIAALAESTDLPPPTIHRLIRTLVALGYVRQLPSRRYTLGPRLSPLGECATRLVGAWSRPYLSELVKATGETANMAILEASMVVYVAQVPSDHPMRTFTEVGQRVHPHCTGVGKALLTHLPDDVVRSILNGIGMPAYTPNTLTDPESLIHDLELTRYRGYGADEGEQEVGLRCFSVPVPNAPTPTAISVSGPTARVALKSAEHVVPLLKHVASKLSVELASKDPRTSGLRRASRTSAREHASTR